MRSIMVHWARWRLIAVLIFIALGYVSPGYGETVDSFRLGNEAYVAGDYEQAIMRYEACLDAGDASAEVHYNLANAYARTKAWGLAILHYERALRIRPRDKDINSNLQYVQTHLTYSITDKRSKIVQQLDRWLRLAGFSELLLIVSICYSFWIMLSIFSLLLRSFIFTRYTARIFLACTLLTAIPAVTKYIVSGQHEAVVITSDADVKYGPSWNDKTAFRLQEGLTVYVKEERDDWVRVRLMDGTGGWMAREAVLSI